MQRMFDIDSCIGRCLQAAPFEAGGPNGDAYLWNMSCELLARQQQQQQQQQQQ
eukprot:CAMPEP_0178438864 /NCGR_PEP_ID=MMETSP0689_2-20121128/35829_1 /TAXON_ID=160604 /ORGANISM="Amphidinium massartii, Strain CS-259" /LENGTH=52 /DNA_ID=CAMNT_0020061313 /DNA_START=85 /DNA_END=240 /DNA_ORIENTATION=+